MKTKLFALSALLIAGICHAQTVTITTGGEIDNTTFTNTNPSQPAVILATNQPVILQGCTINSPVTGLNDNASANGSQLTILGCTVNCTASGGLVPGVGIYLIHGVNSLLCNNNVFNGWAAPVSMNGMSGASPFYVTCAGNNLNNNLGPSLFTGLDTVASNTLEFYSNNFSGQTTQTNWVEVTNTGTNGASFGIYYYGNKLLSGTWHGFALEAQGKFQFVNFAGTDQAKFSWVGLTYGSPGNAGQ